MPNDTKKECVKLYNIILLFASTIDINYPELKEKAGIPAIETDTRKIAALISCKLYPPYGHPFMQKFIDRVNKT